jgi:type VI secretion system protein ImpH
MAPQKREQGALVKERLFKEFYRFNFFKAVHLLETLLPGRKALGQTLNPREEAVRFSVKPGLTFPPSDISGLKRPDQKGPAEMEVAFMGLIGPSGVLPYWYNELAIERAREKDFAFAGFLDIFHHRLISLFYLAWKKYNLPVTYVPDARDRHSRYLLSLMGLGTPGLAPMIDLSEESLVFYAGLLSRQVPSAAAIQATVAYFADTEAEVDQFIERLIPLDPEDQTQVGSLNSELGISTVCGSYARENQSKFRISLGPMSYDRFVRFFPTGDMLRPIFSLTRFMVGIEYEFEVRPVLRRETVPLCTIGVEAPTAPRLGWSTWLKAPGTVLAEHPYVTFQETDLS